MKRPRMECKARCLALLRAQACTRNKPAHAAAQAQAQAPHTHRPQNGNVDDIATLRKCLAALIASKEACQQPVRAPPVLQPAGSLVDVTVISVQSYPDNM